MAPRTDSAVRRHALREEVLPGLRRSPKSIPSKYLYDEEGSRLFEEICGLEEYYLTRTELDILRRHADEIALRAGPRCRVIEPGSGSGVKTRILLERMDSPSAYVPVDISRASLEAMSLRLRGALPGIPVEPLCADFARRLALPSGGPALVFFPGSTIGNFPPPAARRMLRRWARLGPVVVGVDLKKDVRILERAYNDAGGVTARFNRNVLARLNRELGAGFRLETFAHRAFYDVAKSRIEMHLVSDRAQAVPVGGESVTFAASEPLRTEISCKYAPEEFRRLASSAGLEVEAEWTDPKRWFAVCFLRASA